jgi:hypothetical protein
MNFSIIFPSSVKNDIGILMGDYSKFVDGFLQYFANPWT